MATTYELREKALRISHEARAKLNEITDKTDEARAKEIEAEFDRMMADADALEARAKKIEAVEALETALTAADARRPNEDRSARVEGSVNAEDAILAYLRTGQVSAEQRAVLRGLEVRALSSTDAGTGGYTVPKTWADQITVALAARNPLLDGRYVTLLPTDGGETMPWPSFDGTSYTANAVSENNAIAENTPGFGNKDLKVYKIGDHVKLPNELLSDTKYPIQQLIVDYLAEGIDRKAGAWLTSGNGSTEPEGAVTAVTSGAANTAVTATVTYDDFVDVQYQVTAPYRVNGVYMLSETAERQARKLKDTANAPVWAPAMSAGQPNTINGKPYFVNPQMNTATTAGIIPVVFGDFKKFIVRTTGVNVKVSDVVAMLNDQTVIAHTSRIGSILSDTRALGALKYK